jgi:hypothetical protein
MKAAEVNGTPFKDRFSLSPSTAEVEEDPGFVNSLKVLLSPGQRKICLPLWTVWLCFGFSYYGVLLFGILICIIYSLVNLICFLYFAVARVYSKSSGDDDGQTCSFVYWPIFTSAAAEIVGCMLTVFIIDKWGRVRSQALWYSVAGAAALMFGVEAMPSTLIFIFSLLARMGSMGASACTWVATPELFNTRHRATAHAIANLVARSGSFLSPFLIGSSSISNFSIGIILAIVNLVTVIAVFMLPETKGKLAAYF